MRERGYSLPEMLTVIAIVGMIAIIGIPAFMVLMPQYRVRSAASELAATVRMARQNSMTTRRPWRVTFDGTNHRYTVSEFNNTTVSSTTLRDPANWTWMASNDRPAPGGTVK